MSNDETILREHLTGKNRKCQSGTLCPRRATKVLRWQGKARGCYCDECFESELRIRLTDHEAKAREAEG